jgi:hypothetical protein
MVFGMLRYVPSRVLRGWIESAQPVGHPSALMVEDADIDVEFWPSWPDTFRGAGRVEPDVLLTVGSVIYVVEAKLNSPQGKDQLARQWKAAWDWCSTEQRGQRTLGGLLYVTAHVALPSSDFEQAFAALRDRQCPSPLFYWLPWAKLSSQLDLETTEGPALILTDLSRYLDAERLRRFAGWPQTCRRGGAWSYARAEIAVYWRALPASAQSGWHYRGTPSVYWNLASALSGSPGAATWTYPI